MMFQQYGKILYEVTKGLKGTELESAVMHFFRFLQDERVLSKAEYIIQEFERYAKKQEGINVIEITSARELAKSEIQTISAHFGEQVEVLTRVDPSLIGGVTIKTENTILNGSVRAQLEKLHAQL